MPFIAIIVWALILAIVAYGLFSANKAAGEHNATTPSHRS